MVVDRLQFNLVQLLHLDCSFDIWISFLPVMIIAFCIRLSAMLLSEFMHFYDRVTFSSLIFSYLFTISLIRAIISFAISRQQYRIFYLILPQEWEYFISFLFISHQIWQSFLQVQQFLQFIHRVDFSTRKFAYLFLE